MHGEVSFPSGKVIDSPFPDLAQTLQLPCIETTREKKTNRIKKRENRYYEFKFNS